MQIRQSSKRPISSRVTSILHKHYIDTLHIMSNRKGIHVVIPHWLWSCAERWERVDERVFELTKETEIQLDDVRFN